MSKYIITYIGGNKPATEEEGKQHMADYQTWLGALGEAAVSPMNPFRNTHTLGPGGEIEQGSKTSMSGYTVVEAESIDDAIALAKDCPFLNVGGSLEVSELVQMPS